MIKLIIMTLVSHYIIKICGISKNRVRIRPNTLLRKNTVTTMSKLVPSSYLLGCQENLVAVEKDPKYL